MKKWANGRVVIRLNPAYSRILQETEQDENTNATHRMRQVLRKKKSGRLSWALARNPGHTSEPRQDHNETNTTSSTSFSAYFLPSRIHPIIIVHDHVI